jgi:PIN domain nuclease of toxin-antitoxin system
MRLLLDTHAFVWWDQGTLPLRVIRRIQEADSVFVSAATAWEIAIKSALGKMVATGSVAEAIADYGFADLPVSVFHAEAVRGLPHHHRDPFDRLLVVQARAEGLTLVSKDEALRPYDVPLLWG